MQWRRGLGVGSGRPGVLIVRCGLSDQMRPFKIFENKTKYVYVNLSAWKEYCEKLAPVLRIWHKKYLSGEIGGERKKYQSANPR